MLANKIITQAISDGHLLAFSTPEEIGYFHKTKNLRNAIRCFRFCDDVEVHIYSRMFCHKKPRYKKIDWFFGSAVADYGKYFDKTITDYSCTGYVGGLITNFSKTTINIMPGLEKKINDALRKYEEIKHTYYGEHARKSLASAHTEFCYLLGDVYNQSSYDYIEANLNKFWDIITKNPNHI